MNSIRKTLHAAPYEMVGAGSLVSAVWKHGDLRSGWAYRFNIFRMRAGHGRVSQFLRPSDIHDLVKLSRVLAAVLADDGCIPLTQRLELRRLAHQLETITDTQDVNHAK
jgi:hypothetical protein